jgi:hypothetical protein
MLLAAVAVFGLMGVMVAGDKPISGVVQVSGQGCTNCGPVATPAMPADACAPPALPAGGDCGCPVCERERRYGINPLLKRLMIWKKDNVCGVCGIKGKLAGCLRGCRNCGFVTPPPGIGYPGTPGAQMPGTLVFPNHYYSRSPRDWFEK